MDMKIFAGAGPQMARSQQQVRKVVTATFTLLLFTGAWNTTSAQVPEHAVPAATNISPNQCPCILPDNRVMFVIRAPEASGIQVDLGGRHDMVKDDQGVWTTTTGPLPPGFHYYSLVVDGVRVSDPASESFFGTGRMSSALEIPEPGIDFYAMRDVPQGDMRYRYYPSEVTNSWRKANIYTPPGYNENTDLHYPVLYLWHGGGEDERGWAQQGRTDIILNNLIASGDAVPMIIVIGNGNAGQARGTSGYNQAAMDLFRMELVDNLMPFIEKNFRVLKGPENTAIAGLSMGGGQSFYTGLQNTGIFGSVGIFSTGLFGGIGSQSGGTFDPESVVPGILTDSEAFNRRLRLFYISVGEQDGRIEATRRLVDTFHASGLEVEFSTFPGDHVWQVWRKSLHDFASRLFR
jgi:enterochelin esterase-like enzyme